MSDGLEDILVNGYILLRRNLKLGVPFLLEFLSLLVVVLLFGGSVFLLFTMLGGPDQTPQKILLIILLTLFLAFIFFLLFLFISSFFSAGAIGMAKKLIESGETSLSVMVEYGKSKAVKLFLFNIISSILFIGLFALFIIPLFLGVDFFSICVFILTIVLLPLPYAIVLSDAGFFDSVKQGFSFLKKNILNVLLLYFITGFVSTLIVLAVLTLSFISVGLYLLLLPPSLDSVALSMFLTSQLSLITLSIIFILVIGVSLFLGLFILSPLVTLWWSRLYIVKTENAGEV